MVALSSGPKTLLFVDLQVKNLPGQTTLAIAANFVDGANVARFVAQLLESAMMTNSRTAREYYELIAAIMANHTTFPRW